MSHWFDRFTAAVAAATGSVAAFIVSCVLTLVWLISGFWMDFNEAWNFWANTSTTVLTLLLLFVVQHTQNKDNRALHLKLDELIRRIPGPRDELAGIEKQPIDVIDSME